MVSRKLPKHPDRVDAVKAHRMALRSADRLRHISQLAAMLDRFEPRPDGKSHFADALPSAGDPLGLPALAQVEERQHAAVDAAVQTLVDAHRDKTLIEIGLELQRAPLRPLVAAGLVRSIIELETRLEQPKQAAVIRHADRTAARQWVQQEWQRRRTEFNDNKSRFAHAYVRKVLERFGVQVKEGTIRTDWIAGSG